MAWKNTQTSSISASVFNRMPMPLEVLFLPGFNQMSMESKETRRIYITFLPPPGKGEKNEKICLGDKMKKGKEEKEV